MLEPTIPPPMTMTSAEFKTPLPQGDRIRKTRGQTGLPANCRQTAPEIHGSLVCPQRTRLRDSTKLAAKCLFGIFGGRVGRKRVDDLLPLRGHAGPGLLQHPEA